MGFSAVIFIIYGITKTKEEENEVDDLEDPKEYARSDHFSILKLIFLIACPLLVAIQNILIRKMRKIN